MGKQGHPGVSMQAVHIIALCPRDLVLSFGKRVFYRADSTRGWDYCEHVAVIKTGVDEQ